MTGWSWKNSGGIMAFPFRPFRPRVRVAFLLARGHDEHRSQISNCTGHSWARPHSSLFPRSNTWRSFFR